MPRLPHLPDRLGLLGLLGLLSLISLISLITLAACTVGPDYKKPAAPMPPAYKEATPPPGEGQAPAVAWKPAQPSDQAARGKWWEPFADPQLNALEEQIAVSNQTLALAEAQFRSARAQVLGARAALFPSATAGASASRSKISSNRTVQAPGAPVVTRGATTDYQLPVDLSYELDVWGRVRRTVEASVASAQASAADLEAVRLTLQTELALDYFQLRGLDAEKRLLDTTAGALQTALQLTTNRYNQGVVSGVDVAQAQTLLEQTRAQATDTTVSRSQLEHAIAILTGKPPAELTIPPTPLTDLPPQVPAGLPSELLERRPDVAAAERRMAAANAQVGVATAAYFPTLTLTATGGLDSSTLAKLFTLPSRFWSLGGALVETVLDLGKRRSAREQALANYDAAVAAYRESVLGAFQQVEDNLAALRILSVEAAEQAAAVTAAERSLTLAKNRYQGGITTYLEVITAQDAALANERVAVQILSRRLTACVNLVKALGGGWSAGELPRPAALIAR